MKVFNLLPGDIPKVVRVAIIAFAVAVGQIAAETSAQSLFSLRFGVEYLPMMYLIEVVVIPLEIWAFVKLADLYGKANFLKVVYGCLTAVVLLNGLALISIQYFSIQASWFYPVLFLTSNIAERGFVTLMWLLAEDMCTTRQAKRIFPVLIGCYTLGSILTGFFINHTNSGSGGISPEFIYFIWPCMMVLVGKAWWQVVVRYIEPMSILTENEQSSDMLSSIRIIHKSAFLRVALMVMVLLYGVAFLMEYELTTVSKAIYSNEEELTAFWGLFLAIYYTSGLVVGGVFLGPLLERFGIGTVVVMIAGLSVLAFSELTLLIASSWTLTAVSIGGVMMYIVMYTIADPTYQLFFKTIPTSQRTGVRLVFGGALFAGGKLLCSAVAALHSLGLINLTTLSMLGLILTVCMLVLAIKQKRLYFIQLINNVRDRFISIQDMPFSLAGQKLSALELAPVTALLSGDKSKIKLGLEIYGSLHITELAIHIKPFLVHEDAEIRLLALRAFEPDCNNEGLINFRQALQDNDIRIVAEAVKVLGRANDVVTADSRDLLLRAMLTDGGERTIYACEVVGDIGAEEYGTKVHKIMKSSDHPAIFLAAVQCLGKLGWVTAVPDILSELPHRGPEYGKVATQSLMEIGVAAVPFIKQALDHPEVKIWQTAVTVLAEIESSTQTAEFVVESCMKQLENITKGNEMIWALHEIGQPKLAALADMRFSEISCDICEGAWAVLGVFTDHNTVQSVKNAVYSRDAEKREAGLDILAEGLGCRQLSQAILQIVDQANDYEPKQGINANDILRLAVWNDGWIKKILDARTYNVEKGEDVRKEEYGGEIEKLVLLRQAPPFKGLTLDEISRIANIARLERYADQTVIISAGKQVSCMYVVVDGYIEIGGTIIGGHESTISVLKANECFGEDGILSDSPSVITAQVIMGDATVLAIDGAGLKRLLYSYPDIALGMLSEASVRLNKLQWRLVAQG